MNSVSYVRWVAFPIRPIIELPFRDLLRAKSNLNRILNGESIYVATEEKFRI